MSPVLERYQVILYLAVVSCGLWLGDRFPGPAQAMEVLLWPALGALLYATFLQVPLAGIRDAAVDRRFLAAGVVGNFALLPLLVWVLLPVVPDEPAIRLGVLLVLLVPCTDWFITFTRLGGGDVERAIAFAPVALVLQFLLLPLYLWVFLGPDLTLDLAGGRMLAAFVGLILLPLGAAALTRGRATEGMERLEAGAARVSIGLLALVLLLVAASQVEVVRDTLTSGRIAELTGAFVLFLVGAGVLGRVIARILSLPVEGGRTLAFSFGTRNSFVVLPMALALPDGFEAAASVVALQALVELFGMVLYLWWVPRILFPSPRPE